VLAKYGRQLSMWEIAHQTFEFDPNHLKQYPPLKVQNHLRMMAYHACFTQLQLNRRNGGHIKFPHECIEWDDWNESLMEEYTSESDYRPAEEIELQSLTEDQRYIVWQTTYNEFSEPFVQAVEGLRECWEDRVFDKNKLDSTYVEHHFYAEYCLEKGIELPDFWFDDESKEYFESRRVLLSEMSKSPEEVLSLTDPSVDARFKEQTPRLRSFNRAARAAWDKYWLNADPDDRSTGENNEVIEEWIVKNFSAEGVGKGYAKIIQRAIRHKDWVDGGRK